ncbi:MAG: DUF5684 domain-containing protein [Lentisphaeraceae bacterium]|nr:DUF5684 domain-containing protein [Lentisphaeraceae bacterium]
MNFILAQSDGAAAGIGIVMLIVQLAVLVAIIAGLWKTFTKAGQPGWASIIPIYNGIVLLKIAKKPVWWIILLIVPFVNIIIGVLTSISIAKNFGKDALFGICLALFGFVMYPILGFGGAQYQPAEA